MTKTARIEVFRTGTFTPMEGPAISYSAADLKAVADAYDEATAPAPIVVGHPTTDAPAFGWAKSFDFDAATGILHATVGEIAPAFSEAVKAGHYKKVSLQFHRPEGVANPVPGTWYPKHIGFLGGMAPAVTGLKNVAFSGDATDSVTFSASFGERGFEQTSSLLRMLREFLIEKFGMEDADKALPSYQLEWLNDATISNPPARPAFSTPAPAPTKENDLTLQTDPAFAAREADFTTREANLKEREQKIAHADNVSFAETLVTEGKIIPASKDKIVAFLDAVPIETSVSFAAGEAAVPLAQAFRTILSEQPKVISFGRTELPAPGSEAGSASFASDGKPVDAEQLDIHARAIAHQLQHPGMAFLDAVRAVS
ncbi:phage protease [Rhizobium herbae]|uniref:Peptidase n=1 Tax=Rhizobium herbae TaxID=508661 RepID=A0ABS4EW06_9HYPH|nr:phage protease [Rhizobium herbae]MBP1862151.1 hypothetical protein [Rhizobium herbae]